MANQRASLPYSYLLFSRFLTMGVVSGLLLTSSVSRAQVPPDQPRMEKVPNGQEPKTLGLESRVLKEGQPVLLRLRDKREIRIEGATEVMSHRAAIISAENTCQPNRRIVCELVAEALVANVRLVWSQNPDPKKVGRTVEVYNSPLSFPALIGGDSLAVLGVPSRLAKTKLVCKEWDWLPPFEAGKVRVDMIKYEEMKGNPETKRNENMTFRSAYNAIFERVAPDTIEFRSAEGISLTGDETLRLGMLSLFAPNTVFQFIKPDGDFCEISFSLDTQNLANEFGVVLGRLAKNIQPLKYTKKGLVWRFDQELARWLDAKTYYHTYLLEPSETTFAEVTLK